MVWRHEVNSSRSRQRLVVGSREHDKKFQAGNFLTNWNSQDVFCTVELINQSDIDLAFTPNVIPTKSKCLLAMIVIWPPNFYNPSAVTLQWWLQTSSCPCVGRHGAVGRPIFGSHGFDSPLVLHRHHYPGGHRGHLHGACYSPRGPEH